MPNPLTRRLILGTAAAGPVSLAAAMAATQPPALLGTVQGQRVTLPPLMSDTDVEGATPNPDPLARRLGVAVVGLGHLSLNQILPGFGQAKHVRLTALVSGERDKALAVAAEYGLPDTAILDYANFDRLREREDVDIVYIVLPNSMHREYTERAAAAGKHVLCEKPMATSSADAQAMVDACAAARKRLMIAYRCQYEPYNRGLIKLTRGGELGNIRFIEAVNGQNNADSGQWRHIRAMAGGGSLPDVGLYCLNAARYLTGEEPIEISVRITQPKDDPRFREVEDLCSFTLRFPSGILASCASGYSLHDSRRLRVMGDRAWAELDPAFAYQNLEMRIGRRDGQATASEARKLSEKNQFALEMDAFAGAIRANRVPRTPGEEGLQDMRLIEAIYRAAETGTTIQLPPSTGRDITRGPETQDGPA